MYGSSSQNNDSVAGVAGVTAIVRVAGAGKRCMVYGA